MYARSQNRPHRENGLRIPEHYSGCAFSTQGTRAADGEKEERPSSLPIPLFPLGEKREEDQTSRVHAGQEVAPALARHSPAPFGMQFDELLILGLIFLLGRNEEDPEILLLLALLLLCG